MRLAPDARGLSAAIADELAIRLRAGVWRPGEKLPTIPELMREFGVSRSTVRDALMRLAGSGLIAVVHGEGTYVRQSYAKLALPVVGEEERERLCKIFMARKIIEVGIAEQAARWAEEEDLVRLRQAIEALYGGTETREADFAFHRSLARATHNDVLTALFETLAEALSMALEAVHRTIAALPERLWSVRRDHRAIYAAVMKKDGRAAHRAMLRHLSRVEVWFGCAPEGLRQPCPVMMNEFHE